MIKYREILRLTALGLSLREIEKNIRVSQKTIIKVRKRAKEISLSRPLAKSLTDGELDRLMFPKETTKQLVPGTIKKH